MPTPTPPSDPPTLRWSAQLAVLNPSLAPRPDLSGDKILLPPSALEQLLSASATLAAEIAAQESQPSPQYYGLPSFPGYESEPRWRNEAQYQEQRHNLPHPLTFRLVNSENGRVVFAGIREFSAEEGSVGLSPFLWEALGLKPENVASKIESVTALGPDKTMTNGHSSRTQSQSPKTLHVTVHAKQLPKGTYVRLRPLEPGYDPDDWKALLEQHLRQNYTTFTNGEVLVVPGARGLGGNKEEFRFLIDGFQPEGAEGICIVDTDLEVDIEALNEEQARETLARIAQKLAKAPNTDKGSSAGGEVNLFGETQGQVLPGEYVDYTLPSWNRTQPLELELEADDDVETLQLLVSPLSALQRSKPRLDEFVFADLDARPSKRIKLEPSNIEMDSAEAVYISVHALVPEETQGNSTNASASAFEAPAKYTLRVRHPDKNSLTNGASAHQIPPNEGDVQCQNCQQWIPQRTLMLHENFCLRNNILCPQGCGQVFQKRSPEFQSHWHCPHDSFYGNQPMSFAQHNTLYHPSAPLHCPDCSTRETFAAVPFLAQHRTTTCPAKLILCRFCHLIVPQDGDPDVPNPEALLSGLTPHELADGARTTDCHLCQKIVRLRDMHTHLRTHDLDRLSRPAPRPCRNLLCGRTVDGCSPAGDTRPNASRPDASNPLALCPTCFTPLYVSLHDPDGKALRRRVERRYLQQLLTGCTKPWCRNPFCKSGRTHLAIPNPALPTKDALPLIKPFLQDLTVPSSSSSSTPPSPLHFCTDEPSQQRRAAAEVLSATRDSHAPNGAPMAAAPTGYAFEWCLGALEAKNGDPDAALAWLRDWAPRLGEERR